MEENILLAVRIGVTVLLWLFVLLALRALKNDTRTQVVTAAPSRPRLGRKGTPTWVRAGNEQVNLSGLTEVTLGRSPSNTFPLVDDFASGTHARLTHRGNDWIIEDLDSRNGTFVNGYKIDQPETVDTTDEIKIGQTIVRLVP